MLSTYGGLTEHLHNVNKSNTKALILLFNDLDSCGGSFGQFLPQKEGGEPANGLQQRGQVTKEAMEARTLMLRRDVESPSAILLHHVGLQAEVDLCGIIPGLILQGRPFHYQPEISFNFYILNTYTRKRKHQLILLKMQTKTKISKEIQQMSQTFLFSSFLLRKVKLHKGGKNIIRHRRWGKKQ